MPWYQLTDAHDTKLDELARQYNLHPLHIEDCRSAGESVKVDTAPHYTFAVFKPVRLEPDKDDPTDSVPVFTPIDVFAGKDFLITIADPACPPPSRPSSAPAATAKTNSPASFSTSSSIPSSTSTFPRSTSSTTASTPSKTASSASHRPRSFNPSSPSSASSSTSAVSSSTPATPRSTSSATPAPSSRR